MNHRKSQLINEVNLKHMNKENIQLVSNIIMTIRTLSCTARTKGLLSFDEFELDIDRFDKSLEGWIHITEHRILKKFLKQIFNWIIDESDPIKVKELSDILMASNYLSELELFLMMIIQDGVIMIREGVNPRLIEGKLWAYIAFKHRENLTPVF